MKVGVMAIAFSVIPAMVMLFDHDLYGFLGFSSAALGWTVAFLLCKRIKELEV